MALPTQRLLVAAAVAFAVLTLATFPRFFASADEHEYLKNAFLLQSGTLTEADRAASCKGSFTGTGYVSHYFIGRSLFLIPFTWLGFGAVMLSGLVIHVLNFALLSRIMAKLQYHPLYSLLYLLYPALVWEARTLNSELLVVTGLFAGALLYLSRRPRHQVAAGFAFSLVGLVRQDALLLLPGFFLLPLLRDRRKFIRMAAGAVPALLLLLWTNQLFYGGALTTGYGSPLSFITDLGTNPLFFPNLAKFLLLVGLVYPLLVAAPFLTRSPLRTEVIIASLTAIVFYAENTAVANFPLLHPTAVTGQLRYLIPAIGLLLIAYPPLVEKLCTRLRLPPRTVLLGSIAALFAIAVAASAVHASFLDGRYGVFLQIYEHTTPGSLIIGSSDDCNYVLRELFGNRAYLNAGNPDIEALSSAYPEVFVLDLSYGTVDYASPRGGVVARERQQVKDYLAAHADDLQLVFATATPHQLKLYKLAASGFS